MPSDAVSPYVSRNPARFDDVVAEFPLASVSDVVAACRSAHAAQAGWAAVPAPARGRSARGPKPDPLATWQKEHGEGYRYERDPEQAREAGVALARLHRAFSPLEPSGNLPTGGFSEIDAVRRALFLADAAACERLRGNDREAVHACVASLDEHLARIEEKLVERGLPLQRMSVCHGDYHPGNTLWFGVALGAVIDFDSARHESISAEVANATLQFSLKHRVGENPDAWQIGLDSQRLRAFSAGYRSQPAAVPLDEVAPLVPWLMMSAVIAEAAAPIVRDGDFAGIPALPFLRATTRLVDWLSDRTRALSGLFAS